MDIGMVKTEKLTTEKIIKAVRGSAGIKASIARKLNVHRHTLDAYEKKYVSVRQAIEEE
jgi:ActR/RegA family two-component response regulator